MTPAPLPSCNRTRSIRRQTLRQTCVHFVQCSLRLILCTLFAGVALAAEPEQTASPMPVPPIPETMSQAAAEPNFLPQQIEPAPGTHGSVGVHGEATDPLIDAIHDQYWIVSSWKSPQQFDNSPRQFRPEVTCYRDGVGYHHKTMKDLQNSLIPGVPICIVVHGSFMDHPSVRPESLSTWKWLKSAGKPVQFIYFSWPSDRPLTLAQIDIAILGNRASYNGFYLASLIKELPGDCPLSLIGHSHGTRVISSALHLMSGGDVEGITHPCARCSGRRIRTVFVASAIDHDWLNPQEHFGRALMCTECLINLTNHKDPALFIYPFRRIGSSRALGCTGFTKSDRRDLNGWNTKVRDLDVSGMIGAKHMWPSYLEQKGLARHLQNYLFFADVPAPIIVSDIATAR